MRRISIFTPALAVLLVVPGPALGLTFLEMMTGDDAFVPDARSTAMGKTHASMASGAFTAATNPALLSRIGGSSVVLGGSVFRNRETRSIPAFDSFDSFLVESVYVLNDEYQFGLGGGLVIEGLEWLPLDLGLGVSYAPVWDFQYDYSEEVRDNAVFTQPRDQLIAVNEVQSDGSVDAWTIGLGLSPMERLGVGASIQIVNGDQSILHQTRFVRGDSTDATGLRFDSLSGTRGVFGITGRPSHKFEFGATWRTEVTLDGDYSQNGNVTALDYLGTPASPADTAGTVEIVYPHQVVFGMAFFPRAKLQTAVRVDIGWTEWTKYRHGFYEETGLDNVWEGRVGIEHVFYNGMAARFGFLYQPSPQDDEITTSAFTLGAGIDVGPFRTDLAIEIGNRQYRFDDLFAESTFGGNDRSRKDLVEEKQTSGFLTLSYSLDHLGGLFQ